MAHNDFYTSGTKTFLLLKDRYKTPTRITVVDTRHLNNILNHAWHFSARGYVESRINGKLKKLHQFVSGYPYVDHKDGDKLNNMASNLRSSNNASNSRK